MSKKSSGGGSDEVKSTKIDAPEAATEANKGAEFSGVEATGPTPEEITAKVDPESGDAHPKEPEGGEDILLRGEATMRERGEIPTSGDAKILGGKRFRVTFRPPTPVGERAALFECEAESASDALAQWRALTGFTGSTAVEPVVSEITE